MVAKSLSLRNCCSSQHECEVERSREISERGERKRRRKIFGLPSTVAERVQRHRATLDVEERRSVAAVTVARQSRKPEVRNSRRNYDVVRKGDFVVLRPGCSTLKSNVKRRVCDVRWTNGRGRRTTNAWVIVMSNRRRIAVPIETVKPV